MAADELKSNREFGLKEPRVPRVSQPPTWHEKQLISLERTLTHAAEGRNFAANDLNELLGAHAADFYVSRLSAQLVLLPTLVCDEDEAETTLLLLHVHKKRAAELYLDAVMKEFLTFRNP
ncbi:hypothetical protein HPB49_022174 [Dermacentor silvarum]|uniref:Uncharacterized protein n=1 Tax=Dermacentor silvarum TaxID=543639 RepID=A0ACB8CT98_DERSI|nr:hypothetical protein HPB49_022174 [Dermacentor silvarum]